VYVYRRARSSFYYAEAFLDGRKARKSMRTERLETACKLAIDWHKRLLKESRYAVQRRGIDRLASNPAIGELVDSYRDTLPASKAAYLNMKWSTIEPFWRTIEVEDVTPQTFRAFFKWRRGRKTPQGTKPKNHSIHKDVMIVRQVLKYAIEEGHLAALPLIPKVGKIDANPRPWLTRAEFDHLYSACVDRIVSAENARVKAQRQDLDDFLLALVESTARVSELRTLTVGQVQAVEPKDGDPYCVLQITGKTGHRTCIAGGFFPAIFERRAKGLKATDPLWAHSQRDAFRELLTAAKLRTDAFGHTRNLKSIRATAISFRILSQAPNPDLLTIARNAGTSIAMIDAFYARRLSAELAAERLSKSVFD
jgi:hypothetical protein